MCSSPPSAWTEDWRTAPRACRPRSHRRISTLDYDSIHCGLTTKSLPLFLSGQANTGACGLSPGPGPLLFRAAGQYAS